MDNLRKIQVLAALISFSVCLGTYAEQGEETQREIQFITSSEQEILDFSWAQHFQGDIPECVAIFRLKDIRNWFSLEHWIGESLERISSIRSYGRLFRIEYQEEGLKEPTEFLFRCSNPSEEELAEINLYATNEQEARRLTELFIEILDKNAAEMLKGTRDEIEDTKKYIEEADEAIPKLEEEYKNIEAQRDKALVEYAQSNYIDVNESDIDHTIKVMEELSQSLKAVDFELVGLNAKIDSVNKYKLSETIIDDETLIKLNQILMATDIERAGALARKQAYEKAFEQAKQLHDLILGTEEALNKINGYKKEVERLPDYINSLEELLANPTAELRPVEIEDNKVIIRPLR